MNQRGGSASQPADQMQQGRAFFSQVERRAQADIVQWMYRHSNFARSRAFSRSSRQSSRGAIFLDLRPVPAGQDAATVAWTLSGSVSGHNR